MGVEEGDKWGDPRSTGRKQLRLNYQKYLAETEGVWECQDCHKSPPALPLTLRRDHPEWAEKIRLSDDLVFDPKFVLQVDHADKDLNNVDPANASALCPSCHKLRDLKTEKGVSRLGGDPFGHAQDFFLEAFDLETDPNFLEEAAPAQQILAEIMEKASHEDDS